MRKNSFSEDDAARYTSGRNRSRSEQPDRNGFIMTREFAVSDHQSQSVTARPAEKVQNDRQRVRNRDLTSLGINGKSIGASSTFNLPIAQHIAIGIRCPHPTDKPQRQ